jgi:peptidoglycan/xylan/chitin deacetylase (PgdA/CDA1 family)
MYHHVESDRCTNNLDMLEKHLAYISKNFTTVFPTFDKLPKNPICLVFDDGYYDFYKYIFPILKKYNLKALLAVVPQVILDRYENNDIERLSIEHNKLFQNYKKGTFCTWEELKEMQETNLVQIVSHSYSHINLTQKGIDLKKELQTSKKIIEKNLNTKVESFVFPFGKYNQNVLDETLKYYKYAFRIGNAVQKDFHGINNVIYRIDGDFLESPDAIFSFSNMIKFHFKAFIKKLTGN